MENTVLSLRNNNEITEIPPLTSAQIRQQVNLIQSVMSEVMKKDEHYGVIPGTGGKPSLLKPGAEKLIMTFRLVPDVEIEVVDMQGGHREYRIKVKLYAQNGNFLGSGVGSCSTMEGKYRFRTGPVEITDKPVPQEYWTNRDISLIGGKGFSTKKNDTGKWMIAIAGEKVEHDNPADYYNTCLKMAKKRALVDACLTVTAASDIFTQDVEEMDFNERGAAGFDAATAEKDALQDETYWAAGTRSAQHEGKTSKTITEGQRKMLWAKMKAKKMPEDEFYGLLLEHGAVEGEDKVSVDSLPATSMNAVLKDLEAWMPEEIPFG